MIAELEGQNSKTCRLTPGLISESKCTLLVLSVFPTWLMLNFSANGCTILEEERESGKNRSN